MTASFSSVHFEVLSSRRFPTRRVSCFNLIGTITLNHNFPMNFMIMVRRICQEGDIDVRCKIITGLKMNKTRYQVDSVKHGIAICHFCIGRCACLACPCVNLNGNLNICISHVVLHRLTIQPICLYMFIQG